MPTAYRSLIYGEYYVRYLVPVVLGLPVRYSPYAYVLPVERVLRYSTEHTAAMYVVRSMRWSAQSVRSSTSTTRTGLCPLLRSSGESYRRPAVPVL